MSYVGETMSNLLHQTAFLNLTWGNFVMIAVAFYSCFWQSRKNMSHYCSDCIWYAAGKYLSGYHYQPGRGK